jgi:hypothetical protein
LIDNLWVRWRHLRRTGRWLTSRNARTFNEKVKLAKLTWRSPHMTMLSDKVLSKQFVAGLLGPEWVTPTLWHGTELPPRSERNWPIPYVIKANNGAGRNYFVNRPEDEDWDVIERKTRRWLTRKYRISGRMGLYQHQATNTGRAACWRRGDARRV